MIDATGARGRGNGSRPRGLRMAWVALLLCTSPLLLAQSALHITVLDSVTAEPVIGASASIEGTALGAASDPDGHLTINGIADGAHVLRIHSIGYSECRVPVTLPMAKDLLVVRLQPMAQELDEVVVTGTRTNSRIDDAPQKIEVLGEEELQEEGSLKPGNIASLIGDISSVQIQQTSASSGASMVRMQGLDGRHTLLLRDGMPAFGGLSGGFDLLRIPPLDLQRVELLKGPASTFHGGGAIAGSINFVSKAPADSLHVQLLLNRSSLAETNANAYFSGPLGKVGFTLFGGATMQEARDVDGDGYNDVPDARTYTAHPQLHATPWKNAKLRTGMVWQQDQRTGGDMRALDAPRDTARYFLRTQGERIGGDLALTQDLSRAAQVVVKGAWSKYAQADRTNLAEQQRAQENLCSEVYWTHHTVRRTWVVGANVLNNALYGSTIRSQQLSTVGAFTQLALHRTRWPEIDMGLRADAPAGYAVQVLPSVAALYKVNERFLLRANVGTGYQLPDRSRSYGLVYEGVVADELAPGTVPERSVGGTVEWTWKQVLGERTVLFIDQTFFGTAIRDPLTLVTTASGDVQLSNSEGTTATRGIDNYVRITHAHTELYLGYTFTLPEFITTASTSAVPYTPKQRAATTLSQAFGAHWRAGIEASWSGEQARTDGSATRAQLFMAGMVGCTYGMWTVVLNGENITDTRQTRWEPIVSGTSSRPSFSPLWAPIDGRVLNLSVMVRM